MVAYTHVVYKHSLKTKSHQYQAYFLWKNGHLVCSSCQHLIMSAFMTIAENQQSTAAATFGAGAMKHNEGGSHLFHDYHVRIVGFRPGFATDSHYLFHGIEKTIFLDHWKLFHFCCS